MKKIVAANTMSQLLGRGMSVATTVIVTLVVARQFGASGYGDFVKVTTYAALFYLIADFGVNAIFLQHNEREYFPALVGLRLIGGAALIALSLVILFVLPGSASQGYTPWVRMGILLFSPTILLQGLITTANAVFQKKLRYDLATWAIFFGSIVTIALLFLSKNLLVVVGVVAVGTLVTSLSSFLFAARLVGHIDFSPTMEKIKQLFIPSIPLGITLLFNLVYFRADSIIITLTRPTAEVGVYGLAYKVFEVVLVFPTFFMNAVYPLLLKERTRFKKILANSLLFLLVTSFVFLVVLWFVAPLLLFVRNDFVASIAALRVLSLGLPFFFVTSVTMWGLIALKKQKLLATIYGASMVVNVIGNIVLVPTYGFMASAWMTMVGEGIVLTLSSVALYKSLRNV